MARNDGMVQMKAKGTFTRNSPKTGAIIHGDDRDGADQRARFPLVSEDDAAYLEGEGLATRHSGEVDGGAIDDGTGLTIDERAGEFVTHHKDADQSTDLPTGLDTRQTTVFERPLEEIAGAGGANRDVLTASARADREGGAAADEAPAGRDGQGTSGKAKAASKSK